MTRRSKQPARKSSDSIGERLRRQRVDVIGVSLRDLAKRLDIAPIHLSDIETGKKPPSEELLVKIAKAYRLPEAELRAGFSRPHGVVAEVATESTIAAEKVPEFLRRARGLSARQWDNLIDEARRISEDKDR